MGNELKRSLLKVGFSVALYLIYAVLGFISVLTIGYILPTVISMWVSGFILILSQTFGIYLSYSVLSENTIEEN